MPISSNDGYLYNGEKRSLPAEVVHRARAGIAPIKAGFIDRVKAGIQAFKSLPFPDNSSTGPQIIFPTLNDMSAAMLRLISPQSQPSDDPHLSSLVAAGVTWLANTLPEPDLLVKKNFQRKRGGKKRDDDVIERHPFYRLIDEPNPEDTGSDLWKSFAYSWIIKGNVFFIKIRNDFGQVIRLYYEPHFTIRARWRNDKQGEYIPAERSQSVASIERNDDPRLKINYYEVDRNGGKFRIEPADVIHFKDGIDPFNTRYGISRITTILREIYQDSAVASYAADLLGGFGVIPFIVGIEDKEGIAVQEDLDNIKQLVVAQIKGAPREPVILNNRHTFTRTSLTPQELDLRASRSMAQDIFSAVTGIPAIVLNFSSGMERSIYNNMSEADRRAVTSYLQPIWWHRDQVLTRQLLRDIDQDETHFIESDLSEVGALQEDENAKWERYGKAYKEYCILKRSDALRGVGYEPAEDGSDDVYFVPAGSSTVTLEEEQIQRDASIEATQNPPEPQVLPPGQQPAQLTSGQPQQLRVAK